MKGLRQRREDLQGHPTDLILPITTGGNERESFFNDILMCLLHASPRLFSPLSISIISPLLSLVPPARAPLLNFDVLLAS